MWVASCQKPPNDRSHWGHTNAPILQYMSEIMQTQKLGVNRWHATSRATVWPAAWEGLVSIGPLVQTRLPASL